MALSSPFAYVTIGGTNQVKVYTRGAKPQLVATIPVGDLPHGIWPSGDGSHVYVALENGGAVAAIDTMTNKVVANIPIGQTAQALVYVPNAVPEGSSGTRNMEPLGEAAKSVRLELRADKASGLPDARASAPDGGVIAQAIGPLKTIASGKNVAGAGPRRFLIVTLKDDSTKVVPPQILPE